MIQKQTKHYEHEGTFDYSKEAHGGMYQETNLFLKEAGEAMGLPQTSGPKVARKILRDIVKLLPNSVAKDFKNSLPHGLKEECSRIPEEIPKEEMGMAALKADIQNSTGESADPQELARNFWSFLRAWLEFSGAQKTAQDVFESLPKEIKAAFSGMDDKWNQKML